MTYNRIAGAVLAAVLSLPLLAQPPGRPHGDGQGAWGNHRFMANLNLTDNQKEQAKAIFASGSEERKQMQSQLRSAHQALQAAVKDNKSDGEIDQLSAAVGNLEAQRMAFQAKQQKKFFSILTDEQKQKLAAEHRGRGPRARQ